MVGRALIAGEKRDTAYTLHEGVVAAGFQFASGLAVGRVGEGSPFGAGTLALQHPHFRARGFDLTEAVPGLFWGTINVALDRALRLGRADLTLEQVDWTAGAAPAARIAPETFSFVRCCLAYDGHYHPGWIYYPHPETKPGTNAHRFDRLEVLAAPVAGLAYGEAVAVLCRADAFVAG